MKLKPRLSNEKIREIRKLLETTDKLLTELTVETGVAYSSLQRLCMKKTYAGKGWSKEATFNRFGRIVRRTRATLTPQDARAIVIEYSNKISDNYGSVKKLAGKYRVSHGTIYSIIRGDTWRVETLHERTLLEHMR